MHKIFVNLYEKLYRYFGLSDKQAVIVFFLIATIPLYYYFRSKYKNWNKLTEANKAFTKFAAVLVIIQYLLAIYNLLFNS